MAEISAKAVMSLREKTGAGMMDCKRALTDASGDVEKAIEVLRERGLAKAGKREGRATSEGSIALAIAGSAGGMVELGCETDFVARTDDFIGIADALAGAVAADTSLGSPQALLEAQLGGEKARDTIAAAIARLGENIELKRVVRVEVEKGVIGGYVHAGGKLGVLVGIATSESDAAVEHLAKDIAMHVAAADPTPVSVSRDGVSPELLEKEREIYRKQAIQEGKPEKVIDRIVDGKLAKFVSEICLIDQAFVKDPDRTVGQLLADQGGATVTAFERFRLGQSDAGDEEDAEG